MTATALAMIRPHAGYPAPGSRYMTGTYLRCQYTNAANSRGRDHTRIGGVPSLRFAHQPVAIRNTSAQTTATAAGSAKIASITRKPSTGATVLGAAAITPPLPSPHRRGHEPDLSCQRPRLHRSRSRSRLPCREGRTSYRARCPLRLNEGHVRRFYA